MSVERTFVAVLTGNSPVDECELHRAVARRFSIIRDTDPFNEIKGAFCYDGNRCEPKNLGWRLAQSCLSDIVYAEGAISAVKEGSFDEAIAATYHEAASAEYYYRFEKNWS